MRSVRSPWSLVLVVLVAAGAVLLMHGLDAHAAPSGLTVSEHAHLQQHDTTGCDECGLAHVLVACVAVIGAAATVLAGRARTLTLRTPSPALGGDGAHPGVVALRPPGWLELSVVRC